MRKPISLNKKHISNYNVIFDDTYLSNGKFIIRRDYVIESFRYCDPGMNKNAQLKEFYERDYPAKFVKTNQLFDRLAVDNFKKSDLCRKFSSKEGKAVYISEDFVKLFSLLELYGTEHNQPLITDDKIIVLMPMREPILE